MDAAEKLAANSPAANEPFIILAGKSWPVPRLAPRQNRVIVPILLRLIPRIIKARDDAVAAQDSDFAYLSRFVDETTYGELTTLAYTAVTRANPDLIRHDFDDMAVETLELVAAVFVIARQAGLLRPAPVQAPACPSA
jgi:hypothetical protein